MDTNLGHVLQKTQLLKNFSIVRSLSVKEFEKIKAQAKKSSKNNTEFQQKLAEKLGIGTAAPKNVPGVLYPTSQEQRLIQLAAAASKFVDGIKQEKLTRDDLAFLLSSMIGQLKLTADDFRKVADMKKMFEKTEDDDEDDVETDDEGNDI